MMVLAMAVAAMEHWSCTWRSYPDKKPLAVSFQLSGDTLTDLQSATSYKVVLNDGSAIVAISPTASTTDGKATIKARTMVIDRLTGEMIASTLDLVSPSSEAVRTPGRCGKVD